jgi:glc operon protein GlcG
MTDIITTASLTYDGARKVLDAAVAHAKAIGAPMCIAVVDPGANLLAFARMDGAKFHSVGSSTMKAQGAVAQRAPTGGVTADVETQVTLAMQGRYTNLLGGLPLVVAGQIVGGIGAGSGTGQQDLAVARAGAVAIGAELFEGFVPRGLEDSGWPA